MEKILKTLHKQKPIGSQKITSIGAYRHFLIHQVVLGQFKNLVDLLGFLLKGYWSSLVMAAPSVATVLSSVANSLRLNCSVNF